MGWAALLFNPWLTLVLGLGLPLQASGGGWGVGLYPHTACHLPCDLTSLPCCRLLYVGSSMYPIMGALRYSHGGPWEVRWVGG